MTKKKDEQVLDSLDEALATVEATVEATPVKAPEPIQPAPQSFRRMKPTAPAAGTERKAKVRPSTKNLTKQKKYKTSGNATLITFPTDRYGITKDIKKAVISAASRIAGDQGKMDLVTEVLGILREHIEVKFKQDKAYRVKLAERSKAAKEPVDE